MSYMESKKKPKISDEDGVDFMPDIEIQSDDRTAILETISLMVKKERRRNLFAQFDDAPSHSESAKILRDLDDKIIIDKELANQFFFDLENAASSVLFDLDMEKRRPTTGQSSELLDRIQSKSSELGQLLGAIDNIAGKGLQQQKCDADDISKLLLKLSETIKDKVLPSVKKSKSLNQTIHPLRIISVNVIKALHDAGLMGYFETDKKKVTFVEDVIQHLLELPAVEDELNRITGDEDYAVNVYLRDHILIELRNFQKTHKILNLI